MAAERTVSDEIIEALGELGTEPEPGELDVVPPQNPVTDKQSPNGAVQLD